MAIEFVQSEEAKREGVCHTREECFALYEGIDPLLRGAAARALWSALAQDSETMALLILAKVHYGARYTDALPKGIGVPLFFGMNVRNYLREQGFGEQELGVHNLDCVFDQILRDAVRLEVENVEAAGR